MTMQIKIAETDEIKTLSLIAPDTGVDWVRDFVASSDYYDDDDECYIMDEDTYDWWDDIIDRQQDNDNRKYRLVCDGADVDELDDYIAAAVGGGDMEDVVARTASALDEWEELEIDDDDDD